MANIFLNDSTIRTADVVNVIDKEGGDRIQVRFSPETDHLSQEELPWAISLIPKHVYVKPKVGECVLIISMKRDNYNGDIFWVGPIISQLSELNYEPSSTTAKSFLSEGITTPKPNPQTTESIGLYPNNDDIALNGRQGNDIILKDNEIWVRVGKSNPENNNVFNKKDPAYVHMKYQERIDDNDNSYNSSITHVADKINLITHDTKKGYNVTDQIDLIDDIEMRKLLDNTHNVAYGDIIMKLFSILIKAFLTHSHPYSQLPPYQEVPEMDELLKFDLNTLFSKSVKIS